MHEDRAGWVTAPPDDETQHHAKAGTDRARCGAYVYGVRRPAPSRGKACRICVRLDLGFAPGE